MSEQNAEFLATAKRNSSLSNAPTSFKIFLTYFCAGVRCARDIFVMLIMSKLIAFGTQNKFLEYANMEENIILRFGTDNKIYQQIPKSLYVIRTFSKGPFINYI